MSLAKEIAHRQRLAARDTAILAHLDQLAAAEDDRRAAAAERRLFIARSLILARERRLRPAREAGRRRRRAEYAAAMARSHPHGWHPWNLPDPDLNGATS